MSWIVYILKCGDGSLYTGITNDVVKRLAVHRAGKGAKYTKGRGPLTLLYQEPHSNRSEASKREIVIKKLNKQEKLKLIATVDNQASI
ncbi:MAG: GIY-YIG nuclease family protein [Sneathiella sp.]|nr:GIY-YIG nuclease family protein [Sneathiella sp.]